MDQLLQGHCKMFWKESGYHGKLCATYRCGKTPRNAQIQTTWLSFLQSSDGTDGDWAKGERRLATEAPKLLNFSRWSNTLCDIPRTSFYSHDLRPCASPVASIDYTADTLYADLIDMLSLHQNWWQQSVRAIQHNHPNSCNLVLFCNPLLNMLCSNNSGL